MFVAVAEELHYRKAALRLHMSQPPLSRQINELESSLGVQLLERGRRGVTLTETGERFLLETRSLLATCEAMGQRFGASITPGPAQLKIGLATVVDTGTLQQVLPFIESAIPGLTLSFKQQSSVASVRDVLQHRLDAAIISMPSNSHDLAVTRLYRDHFCVALPADHRLRARKTISLLALDGDVLFWFKRALNPHFYDECEAVFRRMGYAPKRTLEPVDHHVLLSMIANHGGIGLIPRSLKKIRRGGVIYRELEESGRLFIDVSIAHIAPPGKPALRSLVEKLSDFYAAGRREQGIDEKDWSAPFEPPRVVQRPSRN